MSERVRARWSPLRLDHENTNQVLEAHDLLRKEGVCEQSASIIDVIAPLEVPSPPAHPSNRLITQLNSNWRVLDDPLQWILQRRKGNPRKRNSRWIDRSFCTTRRHGRDYWAYQVAKLVIHDKPPYPDGKYLIKGGGPEIWKKFHLRKEHRRLQAMWNNGKHRQSST
jgi:hypothetical protein